MRGVTIAIITGIVSGVISSFIVSEIYRRKEIKRERRFSFSHDKQMFSKYVGVVINELELYEKTGNNEYLLRTLNEPRLSYSFTEKNVNKNSLDLIAGANNLLNKLENDIKTGQKFSEVGLMRYKADLFRAQLNVLKIKLKR